MCLSRGHDYIVKTVMLYIRVTWTIRAARVVRAVDAPLPRHSSSLTSSPLIVSPSKCISKMPTPVELALTSLLPTANLLPPALLDLATAFVAQSQARASTLKPEEEIGRTYACCHVACQRLGKRLSLEIGKPMPPVKPRVYAKLHTYMNSVLRTPATPRAGRVVRQAVGWVGVLTTAETRGSGGVVASLKRTETGVGSKPDEGRMGPPLTADGVQEPVQDVVMADLQGDDNDRTDAGNELLTSAKRPAKTPLRRKEKHVRRKVGKDDDPGPAGLLPGLGTMFQPSLDWLSDDRRADYVTWKKDIMREIRMMEQKG